MLIFIDGSGDTGFKFEYGSTRYFVIIALIFADKNNASVIEDAIGKFKLKYGFMRNQELKFNKADKKLRLAFMTAINKFDFTVHSLIFDKMKIKNSDFNTKNGFYLNAVSILLRNSHDYIKNAVVKLDGSGERVFRKAYISSIKKYVNIGDVKIISELKFSDSKSNLLIQMADMIAGSVRRACDGDVATKNVIKRHIEKEYYLP